MCWHRQAFPRLQLRFRRLHERPVFLTSLLSSHLTPFTQAPPLMVSLVLLGACVTADVGLIYGTRTYNTKRVAEKIAKASGLVAIPVEKLTLEAFSAFDHLIVGAPTLNTGNVVRRSGTPMDEFLYTVLPAAGSLHGKKVALFGLGEQMPYPSSFCEALDELGTCFRDSGAQLIGRWPLDGYDIWESRAVWNGEFVGLTIDEEDQPEMTDERIERWLKQLKAEGMPLCLQNEASLCTPFSPYVAPRFPHMSEINSLFRHGAISWSSRVRTIGMRCVCVCLFCFFVFFVFFSLTHPHFTQLSHSHSSHMWYRCVFLVSFLSLALISPNCHTPILPISHPGICFFCSPLSSGHTASTAGGARSPQPRRAPCGAARALSGSI